jgi:hypothetical protein
MGSGKTIRRSNGAICANRKRELRPRGQRRRCLRVLHVIAGSVHKVLPTTQRKQIGKWALRLSEYNRSH